jgi:protein SCO1
VRRFVIPAAALVLGLALVLVLAVLGERGGSASSPADRPPSGPYRGSEPPARIAMPSFVLRDQWGRALDSRSLAGKAVVLTFLDSHCTAACPIIAGQIARTFARLTAIERRKVVAVAISTDPRSDTRSAVRSFLGKQHALHALRYLGAGQPLQRLRRVWHAFEILASAETGEHTLHSAPVRVYDPRGIWVSTLHVGVDLTAQNLARDIRTALKGAKE